MNNLTSYLHHHHLIFSQRLRHFFLFRCVMAYFDGPCACPAPFESVKNYTGTNIEREFFIVLIFEHLNTVNVAAYI